LRPSTGVGHDDEGERGGGGDAFDSGKHGSRAGATVDADGVRTPGGKFAGGGLAGGAIKAIGVFVDGYQRDDGNAWRGLLCGEQGLLGFVESGDGFEHQQVDAASNEPFDLLSEGLAGLFERSLAERFKHDA